MSEISILKSLFLAALRTVKAALAAMVKFGKCLATIGGDIGMRLLRLSRNALVVFLVNGAVVLYIGSAFSKEALYLFTGEIVEYKHIWNMVSFLSILFVGFHCFWMAWCISTAANLITSRVFQKEWMINPGVKSFWFIVFSQWLPFLHYANGFQEPILQEPKMAAGRELYISVPVILTSAIFWLSVEAARRKYPPVKREDAAAGERSLRINAFFVSLWFSVTAFITFEAAWNIAWDLIALGYTKNADSIWNLLASSFILAVPSLIAYLTPGWALFMLVFKLSKSKKIASVCFVIFWMAEFYFWNGGIGSESSLITHRISGMYMVKDGLVTNVGFYYFAFDALLRSFLGLTAILIYLNIADGHHRWRRI
jgi:hypothetical protein